MPKAAATPAPRKSPRKTAAAGSPDAPRSEFAQRVLRRAHGLGLKKKDLAARADLSRQTLDNLLQLGLEGESSMPSVRTLMALAVALKVHPYWLVEGLTRNLRVSLHLRQLMQGTRVGFVEDMSAPDGCLVAPGAHFFKRWSAQNLSGRPWHVDKLVCWDDELETEGILLNGEVQPVNRLIPDVLEMPIGEIGPEEVFGRAIGFTAPTQPGLAASYWIPLNADGTRCFDESVGLWVIVHVDGPSQALKAFPEAVTSGKPGP